MAIFLDKSSRVIVQGMTGSEGMKHTTRMLASGTNIVGGVNPKKAGEKVEFPGGVTVAVFGSVADAVKETGANVSVIFVPATFTKAAVVEAVDAQVPLVVVITEGCAVKDSAEFYEYAQKSGKTRHHRPELPRADQPRTGQRRHHPGRHRRPGQASGWSPSPAP
jgi:succinyl-CoA synthetase alpha subunit